VLESKWFVLELEAAVKNKAGFPCIQGTSPLHTGRLGREQARADAAAWRRSDRKLTPRLGLAPQVNTIMVCREGARWRAPTDKGTGRAARKTATYPPFQLLSAFPPDVQAVFRNKQVEHSEIYYKARTAAAPPVPGATHPGAPCQRTRLLSRAAPTARAPFLAQP
jgi:hypothetical protein